MNPNWQDFLISKNAVFQENSHIHFPENTTSLTTGLYPVAHLAVLCVSGKDAAQFLQGQLTCHVMELTQNNSFFAAFCNPKGRVISTLLILKSDDDFLLILPSVLLDKVQKKLQMYVMRSNVQLTDASKKYCLSGVKSNESHDLPTVDFSKQGDFIKLPNSRYLIIAQVEQSIHHWTSWFDKGLHPQNSEQWDYLDTCAGLAWLDSATSEEYIPQMLNIDKLGGISFNKGCYTGQEIVARTHYLGKSKRRLFVGECSADVLIDKYIIINENNKPLGKIIKHQTFLDTQKLLIVMQTSATKSAILKIDNDNADEITL